MLVQGLLTAMGPLYEVSNILAYKSAYKSLGRYYALCVKNVTVEESLKNKGEVILTQGYQARCFFQGGNFYAGPNNGLLVCTNLWYPRNSFALLGETEFKEAS